MNGLIERDDTGNWKVKGLPWKDLYEGETITKDTWEKLYGALCRLNEYEELELSPEQLREVDLLFSEQAKELGRYRASLEESRKSMELMLGTGWIPVSSGIMPEEKENPVTGDFCEYEVTFQCEDVLDIRHYKFGKGHWWHGGDIADKYVTAWRPLPKPYRVEGEKTAYDQAVMWNDMGAVK